MIINYGNPFSASLWIAAGGTSLWLCVQWRRRTVVILSALLIAALVALVQGVTIYRAAVASHSSTGGPIIAALSPVFALQAFLVVFPLAWGISGWILARRAETAERWARSILIVVVGIRSRGSRSLRCRCTPSRLQIRHDSTNFTMIGGLLLAARRLG